VDEISHTAFKENFDLAQVSTSPTPSRAVCNALLWWQYNEALLMANGKFKALFAQ
jgi:hypothetical protein